MEKKENLDRTKKHLVSLEGLKKNSLYPSLERFSRGPVVVVECDQKIPCNPCETVCSKKVISVGKPITNRPKIKNIDSCTGCGMCVVACPGLAIFIIDKSHSEEEALVTIPYELSPLPQQEDEILATNRDGRIICSGMVNKVKKGKKFNHTNLVTIAVPKEFSDDVRFFKKEKK